MPASSAVYDRLETISAWYPVRGLFLGERPMSMRDLRRAVALLSRRVDSSLADERRLWAREQLDRIAATLGGDSAPATSVMGSWRGVITRTNALVERIEPNGLGGFDTTTRRFVGIDAVRHSFDAVEQGLPSDGALVAVLPTGALATPWLAAAVEGFIASTGAARDSGRWAPLAHRAYVRGVVHNAAMRVGADEMRWGQSPVGSMFLSGNAAPLHAITLSTDTPVTLPWLFRHAGPFRLTGVLADLGATRRPSHARLAGWQGSIQPWSSFELGVAVFTHTGGAGAPRATFLERIVDLFPVIDALAPQHADIQISNKVAGGNLRVRLPSGIDFYYELQIDDFDGRRLRSSLIEDSGHLLGLRIPMLVDSRLLAWRAEWQRTSLRLYEHSQFPAGITYHEKVLGNPLGPNAKGAYIGALFEMSPRARVELGVADERRNPSIFTITSSGSRDQGFRFVLDTLKPNVRRDRLVASLERELRSVTGTLTVGAARFTPEASAPRNEWVVELRVRRYALRMF